MCRTTLVGRSEARSELAVSVRRRISVVSCFTFCDDLVVVVVVVRLFDLLLLV